MMSSGHLFALMGVYYFCVIKTIARSSTLMLQLFKWYAEDVN